MSKVVPASTDSDDDDDSDSLPSIESEDEEEKDGIEEEEDDTVAKEEKSHGGRRGAARDQEARDVLGAWKERPEPHVHEDLTEIKWCCYDCRWFLGCCINYPIEDTILLGDLEMVIKAVKRLKRRFPDDWQKRLNQRHPKYGGHTATSIAILEGRQDIAEWLTENGIDIDQRDHHTSLAPLHHAIRQQCLTEKFTSTVQCLLENAAEVDIRDKRGTTPLMLASLFGNLDMVKLLLDNSADLEARDKEGWLPLNYAAYGGRIDASKLLVVDQGASTDVKDKRNKVPENLVAYMHEFEGSRQRHGAVFSFLEAYVPTVT